MCVSSLWSGPEQTSRFGLEVDKKLRVKGAPEGSVWALGDCAVSGCAPTAQSASQQGKYLGSLFRDTKMDKEAIEAHPDFQFINKGSLAYLGDGKGQNYTFAFAELVLYHVFVFISVCSLFYPYFLYSFFFLLPCFFLLSLFLLSNLFLIFISSTLSPYSYPPPFSSLLSPRCGWDQGSVGPLPNRCR